MGYLDNIPPAMRDRKQWMLAGTDKRPLAVDYANESTYFGAKNNPTQRMTYSEARYWAETLGFYVGYVPLPDDPFTIIDLDWKEKVYDVDADGLKQSLYQQACEATYVEVSMSGKGAHIVIEGKLPHDFNAQNAGIECYGNLGFVVITGRMVSQSNQITNQQPWLNWLQNKYPHAVEAARMQASPLDWNAINNPSSEELALDDALIASMSGWRNASNLEHYFYGRDLRPDGGGGSEGDMALMQAFMTFSKSTDKQSAAMRMFLKTPRAKARQPYKAVTSNWDQYLVRTIGRARMAVERDQQRAKDYDFSAGSRAMLEKFQAQISASRPDPEPEVSADSSSPAPAPINMGGMGQRAPAPSAEPAFTGFSWLTKSDLERLPKLEWVIKGLFPAGGVGAIYGESGAGKSFVAIDMIASIAEGNRWFGLRTKQLPVSVFALEGEGGLKGRVKAWEMTNGREYPQNAFFWDSARNGNFALRDADQRSDENRKRLIQLCADLKANGREGGVVVIDTLNQASDGADENSSRDMGELLKAMKFIQRETGSLVLIVHHATKSKENQSMRGHSSLYGAMDGIMEVIRDVYTEDDEPRLIEGRRGWIAKKVKDGRDGYTKLFDMKEVQVDFDEDGPVHSIAIKAVEEVIVDPITGEINEVVNTGSLKAPKPTRGAGSGNGGSGGKRPRAGDRQAPEVTRPKQAPTWNAGDYSAAPVAPVDAPMSSKQAEELEFSRLPFKTAVRDALLIATRKVGNHGLPLDGVPAGKVAIPRKELVSEIKSVLNPTCDPNHPTLKKRIDSAIGYAADSGKVGRVVSNGVQYFWLLE